MVLKQIRLQSENMSLVTYYIYHKYWGWKMWANSVDSDKMPQNVLSDQGLCYLPLNSRFWDTSTDSQMDLFLDKYNMVRVYKSQYLGEVLGESVYLKTIFSTNILQHFPFPHENICCGYFCNITVIWTSVISMFYVVFHLNKMWS